VYMMTQKGDPYSKVFSALSVVILNVLRLRTVKHSLQQCDKTVLH